MGVRLPLEWDAPATAGAASRTGLTSGQLEAVKWLALVAMLVEHTAIYLDLPWVEQARWFGRLAFPLFAMCFAYSLTISPTPNSARNAAFRLLPFAVAAQVGAEFLRQDGVLNILFQFLAVAAWVASAKEGVRTMIFVRACALVIGVMSEFTFPGFFAVLAAVSFARKRHAGWLALGLGSMVLIAYVDGVPFALFAPLIVVIASAIDFKVPRVRNLFAVAYVAQFPVFLALRALL